MKRIFFPLLVFVLGGVAWAQAPSNSSAVKADHTKLSADQAAVKTAQQALVSAVQTFNADQAATTPPATPAQIATDITNVTTARNNLDTARASVAADEAQLQADLQAEYSTTTR